MYGVPVTRLHVVPWAPGYVLLRESENAQIHSAVPLLGDNCHAE